MIRERAPTQESEHNISNTKIAILNFGTLLPNALAAAEHINASVADMRFVKPLDTDLIDQLATQHDVLVTIEENVVAGGAGTAVIEYLMAKKRPMPVLTLGLPDRFIEQGEQGEIHAQLRLDEAGITAQILDYLAI